MRTFKKLTVALRAACCSRQPPCSRLVQRTLSLLDLHASKSSAQAASSAVRVQATASQEEKQQKDGRPRRHLQAPPLVRTRPPLITQDRARERVVRIERLGSQNHSDDAESGTEHQIQAKLLSLGSGAFEE